MTTASAADTRGGNGAGSVALISLPDICQYYVEGYVGAIGLELGQAAPGPDFGRCRDEQFYVCVGANNGADIATIKHRSGQLVSKVPLVGKKCRRALPG